MQWNNHSDLIGTHAVFSPSKPSWLNYTEERAIEVYDNSRAAFEGTKTHEFAALCIERGQRLYPYKTKLTLNSYVNDAVGYQMDTEVPLVYSKLIYGTADSITYDKRKRLLRIHDLKTGVSPAHIEQLEIYAALYCLEYGVKPSSINFELRLYQNDDVLIFNPEPELIEMRMEKVIEIDKIIRKARLERGVDIDE